jgi:hypothetical protein
MRDGRSDNNDTKIIPTNVIGHRKNCAKLRGQNDNYKNIGNNAERHLANCAILRSNNDDKIKIVLTKLTNIVTRKTSTQFTFKCNMRTAKNKRKLISEG